MNICTHCGERCAVVIDLALNVERMTLCLDCAVTLAEMLYLAVMKLHAGRDHARSGPRIT